MGHLASSVPRAVTVAGFSPNFLEPVCHFYTESAPILWNRVLQMESRAGLRVVVSQQIINAGGDIEVFDQILAEQREVHYAVSPRIRSGNRLAEEIGISGMAGTGILEFQTAEDLVFEEWGADIQLYQVHG